MEGLDGLFKVLWRGKFYIALVFALAITATVAAYYFLDAGDLSARLGQKESDYNALNDNYNKLSSDHTTLVASNDDLNKKYVSLDGKYSDLDGKYNQLSSDYEEQKTSYNDLVGKVNRMHETGGPCIAMRQSFYESGPSNSRKKYLEVWIYNIGDSREDRVTVKGRTINADNTTSVNELTFNDVDALDKRSLKWEYSTAVQLDSVWYET